ncbi:Tripartite tricarboxylate transporter TctB family [Burkholderiales bacterium JOSHI_001]|nr:Tripartite tricarboxylate transporter TctB family [Burkholderiales bacterium JOSHI_001]
MSEATSPEAKRQQAAIGAAVLVLAALLAFGASGISSDAGYGGVGPNFLPWMVAGALAVCGALLLWQGLSTGFLVMEKPSGAERGDWPALAWVAAGVLANAALITRIGFILACALCFALAVRGLRSSEGKPSGGARQSAIDLGVGLCIAAPTFWMFTKVLNINLPGLTSTGWI